MKQIFKINDNLLFLKLIPINIRKLKYLFNGIFPLILYHKDGWKKIEWDKSKSYERENWELWNEMDSTNNFRRKDNETRNKI